MARVRDSHHTGRIGIHEVASRVHGELGWLFGEQPEDFGIDALIEVVEANIPTGKIIAAQIKAGPSWFEERDGDGFVFRGEPEHLDYWLNHKLPVIVVLHDMATNVSYWQSVSEETVVRLKKGWKMSVPRSKRIERAQAHTLAEVAAGQPYFQKLNKLQLDRPLMSVLVSGDRLFLEADEWINKLSGRCRIALIRQDSDGEETTIQSSEYWVFYPGLRFEAAVQLHFPWAEFSIDDDAYDDHDHDRWDNECGHYDREEDILIHDSSFEAWKRCAGLPKLRPYSDDSEVASWRLEMTLNDIGRAFCDLDAYLSGLVDDG
jgi:hypothetical protein